MSVATTVAGAAMLDPGQAVVAETLVRWLETGVRPEQMFAADVFGDVSLPHWRVQATTSDDVFAVREDGHRGGGQVRVERLDQTSSGFLLQFEEHWVAQGQRWYARELIHAVVVDGLITELVVYCTGDWDETTQRRHRAEVTLARP